MCYKRTCLEQAVRRKAIGRAFPGLPGNTVPDVAALGAQIVEAIEARIWDALTLGRRMRSVLSGADTLEDAWHAGRLQLLILAKDAGPNSADAWLARQKAAGLAVVPHLTTAELGRSQGAEIRVAVGIVDLPRAEQLRREIERRDRVLGAA